jgi:feruloyl esterase
MAKAYYGAAPERSYFMGCSTGGRQALISAQRFPEDFDGIYAGAPVLNFVDTMVSYVTILHDFSKAPVSEEKLTAAGKIIYARCDENDGVKDGLIEDPRRCGFDPAQHLPRCTGAETAAGCFTDGQIQSLQTLYSDTNLAGRRVFPGWPVGVEVERADGGSGWNPWLVGAAGRPAIFAQFSQAFFRFLASPDKNPQLQIADVDLQSKPPNLEPIRSILNATDTDLSTYRDRGGKLLMWFGWSDPALNPRMGVEYYESVLRAMGPDTPNFFRLYMMPGVFHCGGGPGCDTAPRLAALIDWVEKRKAPESIVASKVVAGKVTRTRPLCPYPQTARYKGSGSIDEAASFTCAVRAVAP